MMLVRQPIYASPDFPISNHRNRSLANAVLRRENATKFSRVSYSYRLFVRQFALAVGSTLLEHVRHVFLLISQKQVIGSNACSVIATVENVLVFGDIAKSDYPGNPRRLHCSSQVELAVSRLLEASRPDPAAVSLADLGPEPSGVIFVDHSAPKPHIQCGGILMRLTVNKQGQNLDLAPNRCAS